MTALPFPARPASVLAQFSEMRAQLQPRAQRAVGLMRAQWLFRSCLMGGA